MSAKKKKIIASTLILIHLLGCSLFIAYTARTKIFTDVLIWSTESHIVELNTPTYKTIQFKQECGDTLCLPKRPYSSMLFKDGDIVFTPNIKPGDYQIQTTGGLLYFSIKKDKPNKIIPVFLFLNNNIKIIPIYLSFWILLFLSWLLLKTSLLRKTSFLKRHFFRFMLSHPGRAIRIETSEFWRSNKTIKWLVLTGLIILITSFFIHSGKYEFSQTGGEKWRILVSQEMKYSNNYIVPSRFGEQYHSKPPLFNWLLIPFIDSKYPEWTGRALSNSFLILCALTFFLFLKKHESPFYALSSAFLFLTSFHLLKSVSLTVNLDALFSLICISIFYLNYRYASENKFLKLFIIGYLLTSLAVMVKGIPALWFQAVSLFFALAINQKLKRLLHFHHLLGIVSLLLIPAVYIFIYSQSIPFQDYIKQLWTEANMGSSFNITEKVYHFLRFPATNLFAFAPALLLLPLLLLRKNWVFILKDKRRSYLAFVSLSGAAVFLLSPYYQPYYILMFVPLLIDLCLPMAPSIKSYTKKEWTRLYIILLLLLIPFCLQFLGGKWHYILIAFFVLYGFYSFRKYHISVLIVLAFLLSIAKLSGVFHLPLKQELSELQTKKHCKRLAGQYIEKAIFIYSKETQISETTAFYLNYFRKDISRIKEADDRSSLYLGHQAELPPKAIILDSIPQLYWDFSTEAKLKCEKEFRKLYLFRYSQE